MTDELSLTWVPRSGGRTWRAGRPEPGAVAFHRALPGYRPTPLAAMPELAAALNVARVLVKDESERLGLPAFKILGASWAIERALSTAEGAHRATVLVAATAGSHGRAVARVARQRGLGAHIFVPAGLAPSALAAIAGEGAMVIETAGTYDEAVELAAEHAARGGRLLIQDVAWPGYEQVPAWIIAGYATLFTEIDAQLQAAGADPASLVAVPAGVGSLAQAAVVHYRRPGLTAPPALMTVEPVGAACILHSLHRDKLTAISTSATIMAGLNCGTPSAGAWPYLRGGIDGAAAVTDAQAASAARDVAELGVPAGPCGAATLAAVRSVLTGPGSAERRAHLGISPVSVLVLLSTDSTDSTDRKEAQS